MVKNKQLSIEIDRLNGIMSNAQSWVETNFPNLQEPLRNIISEARKDNKKYAALTGLVARCVYEGENYFKETLTQEYILTDAVREIVRRIADKNNSEDERIDAWVELKQLLSIK